MQAPKINEVIWQKTMKNPAAKTTLTIFMASALATFAIAPNALAQTAVPLSQEGSHYKPVIIAPNSGSAPAAVSDDAYGANARVGQIKVEVSGVGAAADGLTQLPVTVKVFDRQGAPIKEPVLVTIEHSGGRVQLIGAKTDEFGPGSKDADRRVPGIQLLVVDGISSFGLIAPRHPEDVTLRLTAGTATATGVVGFGPDLREMVAAGLVEGVLRITKRQYDSTVSPVRLDDGFEQELRQWSRSFNDGKGLIAARAAAFLKGRIKGDALLTLAYDSDKETRARLLRDIKPEDFTLSMGMPASKALMPSQAANCMCGWTRIAVS